MTDYVATPDLRILLVLARLCRWSGKLYVYPTLAKQRALVARFTGRAISERTLCRHLGALERDGWLARQRRHETNAHGGLTLRSTLYILRARSISWLRNLGTDLWTHTTAAAKSLIDVALPVLAETLTREDQSHYHRAAHGPPKR